ncbi:MAG: hypothetical protein HY001_03570 [Candidatus Portnoybacteria bacterium]|nr:hypothetical protein [Candidatus Portnoybacteria bacterium]
MSIGSDSKATLYGILAEELPDVIRTKDGKGFPTADSIAWLIGTGRASLNKIDQSSSADYAEWTRVVGDILSYEPGDLLMFSSEDRKVTKAEPFAKDRLMGVVTLNPGPVGFSYDITKDITSGITDKTTEQIEKEYNAKMAATIGYTPIKVSTQAGPLAPGDPITISSTPGVGRRAKGGEKIVGYAMESFDPDSGKMGTHDVDLPTRTYKKFFHPMTTKLPSGLWQGWVFGYVNLGYVGNDLNVGIRNNELGIMNEPLVDKEGKQLSLTLEGTVVIKRLVVKDLELAKGGTITLPKGEGEVIGYTTVSEGATYKIVEHPLVKPESTIFLTLQNTSAPAGISYSVIQKKEGGFTINLSGGAPYPLTFAYWILNTYEASVSMQTSLNGGSATSTVQ